MILGSVGVGIVTARNLVERRREFEILKVLGISRALRTRLVREEVRGMIFWGLGIGLASALIAVIPVIGGTVGWIDLAWMVGLVVAMGLIAGLVGRRAAKIL
jgi:ABC-type antimicrobial peptide transport system permease subunit